MFTSSKVCPGDGACIGSNVEVSSGYASSERKERLRRGGLRVGVGVGAVQFIADRSRGDRAIGRRWDTEEQQGERQPLI